MNGLYYLILLILIVCLLLGVWGLVAFTQGASDQRVMAARGALDETEQRANSLFARLDVRLVRTDLGRMVARRIAASGIRIRVSTSLALIIVSGLAVMVFITQFLGILFGILGAVGVGIAFFAYLRRQEERRRDEFIAQLPELARVLSNATSAGLAVRTAISMAADELGEPAGTELRRTADTLAFGQPFDEALQDLKERLPSRELAVLVSTLVVSARSGGSLVTALRTISSTLEQRKETRRETQTIIGEAVVTSWALVMMGIGALFLLNVVIPGSIKIMAGQLIGQLILGFAVALFVSGILIIRRMTRIDV